MEHFCLIYDDNTNFKMPFCEDLSLTYLRNGNLDLGGNSFKITFMSYIQFCILPGIEKENSSQIYHTCALTVFI